MQFILLLSVFVIATCGLVYELVAGTLASYLLGDSVMQFSTVIGVYLFSMGVGSYLSKFVQRNILGRFIQIEILVGLIGGISSTILFLLFEHIAAFRLLMYFLIFLTGMLVGMEIPLLLRILKDKLEFSDLVSKVLTFDYIGALLASVIFPLVLMPRLGLIQTSFFFGILNVLVAYFVCIKFEKEVQWARYLKLSSLSVIILLSAGFLYSDKIMAAAEGMTFTEPVIYSKTSPYQRIVLTKNRKELKLYLNGNLQFSSADEYRYHESLVHPALAAMEQPKDVLVLGGGDGLAVREVLRYPNIRSVTLVDLDSEMTDIFSSNTLLLELNDSALLSQKVTIVNADAFTWLKKNEQLFDFIAIDFPDPSNFSLGKLYSTAFYSVLYKHLAFDGKIAIQSTSPLAAPKSFWCVVHTLEACGFHTLPYHTYVPSFGEWGFVIAQKRNYFKETDAFPDNLKFISAETFQQMVNFPADMQERDTEINKLNNQALVNYFEEEWSAYGF